MSQLWGNPQVQPILLQEIPELAREKIRRLVKTIRLKNLGYFYPELLNLNDYD